jgi:RNase P/RNase MRP subunit p30
MVDFHQYKPIPDVILTNLQLESARHRRGLVVPLESTLSSSSLRQLSRLTVSVEDVTEAQQLTTSNDTLKQFDIIAAAPSNVKVFAHLCKQADIDIIALDFSHRQSFPINKKLVSLFS